MCAAACTDWPMLIRMGFLVLAVVAALAVAAWPSEVEEPQGPVIVMAPEVTWEPEEPGEGTLFRIRVRASEHTRVLGVHGTVAGEELHFARVDDRTFESIAVAPVGSPPTVESRLRYVYAEAPEAYDEVRIPVIPGSYDHEELRVAPRFGAPPSAEDQEQLDRDRARARAAAARAHRTRPQWTDDLVMPRDSRVTSGFGDGRVFNGQVSSRHMGLDLRGARGDTVLAAARGTVEVVDPFLLAGNVVYVNHGAGLLSAYFHLSRQLVSVGDTVEGGQPIGLVGATGRVTGPHLHWVVRYGMTSVDPRSLLTVLAPSEGRGQP